MKERNEVRGLRFRECRGDEEATAAEPTQKSFLLAVSFSLVFN